MISAPDRAKAIELVEEAVNAGARREKACEWLGLSLRTVQRWTSEDGVKCDARPGAVRPEPANKLSESERKAALALCHRREYASLPPTQIVPREADQGRYIASESTLYRILRAENELHHRGRARAPSKAGPPRSHCARAPNQVWCWDITWLAGPVRGMFFHLYLIVDLYSRKVVGWEVHERENAAHAVALVHRAVLSEQCVGTPLVLHADNGSPQKASTLLATLEALGVQPSYSRPRVSDDNAYAESLFRTCKYRPDYPTGGFATIDEARAWVARFLDWYHHEHCHRGIRFVSPADRHAGRDAQILARRHEVYQQARARHPNRWSGNTRCWEPVGEVWLNHRPQAHQPTQSSVKAA